ncbi:MAG: hypothetical protein LBH29_06060, partial [Elusimicrobiota bacterium]|nr:hypothetical protein [Elusimicrobiota bacterium]
CQIGPVLKKWEDFKKELLESDGNNLPDLDEWISGGLTSAPLAAEISIIDKITTGDKEKSIFKLKPELTEAITPDGKLKELSEFKDTNQARDLLFKTTGLDISNLNDEQFSYSYKSIKQITDRLPVLFEAEGQLIKINKYLKGFSQEPYPSMSKKALAGALDGIFYFSNSSIEMLEKEYKRGVNVGWFPENTDFRGIVIREFAHLLTEKDIDFLNKVVNELFFEYKGRFKNRETMRKSVCEHSAKRDRSGFVNTEFFSDSFVDYIQNGKRANPVAKKIDRKMAINERDKVATC